MSETKRNVPKLRFPGFTEDWEQRKLGDYLSIPIKEQLEVNSSNDLLTVKLNLGGVELGANRDTLSLGSTTYYKRLAGQFIYGKQNFFNGSMGIIPEELDGKGSSGDVPSLNISNILPEFLYTYVSRECYWRPKEASASGTGSKRIHEATLLSFDIAVPDEQEQKLIATCMNGITNLITLHQRKLENLELKKKALLQKLFPKNGEQFPELRFPGFTDAWEQRKSEDIFKSITDKGHSGLPVLSASQEWGMIKRDESGIDIQHDKANENTYKRVLPGQFVIHLRSFQGGFAYSEIEGITSPAYTIIDFKNQSEHYPLFWKHVFKSSVFIKRLETITYGIRDGRSISFSDFKTLSFRYPTLDEQKNIADSIEVFEKYITLHQRKLEHLQLQKKALLQQMFV